IAEDPTTMSDWIDDAAAAQRWLVEQGPHLPLLCVGHSFGGQAATVLSNAGRPDAIVTVGAGSGFWRGSPTGLAARRWLAWTVALPTMCRTFGYLPGWAGLGEDLPAGVARQWAKWCRAEGYFLGEYPQWRAMMAAYDGPVLALSFTDDDYAPVPNVRWLLGRLTNADVEHRHLRPGQVDLPRVGHFGFFRASAAGPLWSHAVLALQHATRQASLGRVRPASRALRDVMADLQYGQA
ncbi:MAG: hypothetical protein K0V04_35350, partial [Deltaproteobacteria bacterium]|nr:hypothetical protein [Deltaproteobacteria bacterium]